MLPPQRVSHGRTRRRRSHHAMTEFAVTLCPLTGMPKAHHRACKESGYVRPGLRIKVPKLGIGVAKEQA
ncbi:MAG: 50S ribosomal protein L32 [Phycisphaerales bacterium]|nr:MAG: 50S ribosomal protein L32 [Phycisphaerales bacterium]